MTASIIEFPADRSRAPGVLPAEIRSDYVARFRAIMAHAVHRETGLPMTEAELDAFAHSTMAAIDRARLELHRSR